MEKIRQLLKSRVMHSLIMMKLRSISLLAKFALTLFIAKFIGFEALGQYGLITGLAIVVPIILGLSLSIVINRKAVTQTAAENTLAIWHYAFYLLLLYTSITVFVIVAGILINQLTLFATIFVLIFFSHINQDIYTLLLNLSRPFTANLLMFIRAALWIGMYVLIAFFDTDLRTIECVLIFWVVGELCAFLCFLYVTREWPWRETRRAVALLPWLSSEFRKARTLYMNSIVNTLSQYSDRYIITWLLGLELTGVYILFWSIGSALSNLVRTGVVQYSRPSLVRAYAEKSASYRSIFELCIKNTFFVSTAMALGTGVFMYFLLPYLDKPLALEWMPVLWFVLLTFIIMMISEVWALVFYSQHRDEITFKISCFTLASSVALNLTLVPFLSLWGTAIALVLTILGTLCIQAMQGRKLLDITNKA